jgi:signal transduction histidine kinase
MRSAPSPVTVGVVARDSSAEAPPRGPTFLGQPPWVRAALLAGCALLLVLAGLAGPYPHERGERLLVALVLCLPIAALRRWPLAVLATATAANALVMAEGNALLQFGIILGVASYLAASRLPRRVSIPAAAASAGATGVAFVYAAFTARNAPLAGEAIVGFLPLLAGWFTGDSVAARRRYLAGLAAQAEKERAAEAEHARLQVREERVRIARELHDVVAHTLAVITVQAGVGRRLMTKRPEEAGTALENIENIGRTAQEELRVVLGLLRDEENRTAALTPAPKLLDVKTLVETIRASGTPVGLNLSGIDRPLSPALELSVYRVVQEALTNVVKHAPGARTTVDLAVFDNVIHLDVTDDGGPATPAADVAPAQPGSGQGIVGMRERITAFGGWLHAEPLPGRGFRVTAQVPVQGSV